ILAPVQGSLIHGPNEVSHGVHADVTAEAGHGVCGIVVEAIRSSALGADVREMTGAGCAPLVLPLQIQRPDGTALRGPNRLGPPTVVTHRENANRWLLHHPVVDALQPVVEPAMLEQKMVHLGSGAEIGVAHVPGQVSRMTPGADDEVMRVPQVLGTE